MPSSGAETDIRETVHSLDKRLAVVETRQEEQAKQMRTIHNALDDVHRDVKANTRMMQQHVVEDAQDRQRIISRQNQTLMTIVLSIAGSLGYWLITR